MNAEIKPLFSLGEATLSFDAIRAVATNNDFAKGFLLRHVSGDWGDVSEDDKRFNDLALSRGVQLLSCYYTKAGVKLFVLTRGDRSGTKIMLAEEYVPAPSGSW